MYHRNISNFGIDTSKYSWLPTNCWDEKQINYFYNNQFIIPSFCKVYPYIKTRSNSNHSSNIISSSWILTEKYYSNNTSNQLDPNEVKAIFSIRSFTKIYNRLEVFYKFFINENTVNLEDIKDIFYLMISALFIVYKADTIEFFNLDQAKLMDEFFIKEIKDISLTKKVFSLSNDLSFKENTIHTLTSTPWKEFRKDDEKRLSYLKNLLDNTKINTKNSKNTKK